MEVQQFDDQLPASRFPQKVNYEKINHTFRGSNAFFL